jgi:uncharacterized membrane protein YfcA
LEKELKSRVLDQKIDEIAEHLKILKGAHKELQERREIRKKERTLMTLSVASCATAVGLGVVAGSLSGSLGIGAGVVVVPALVLLLDCGQKSAQGMSLAFMAPVALLGVLLYARTPGVQLHWALIACMIVGGLVGVLVGARLMAQVPEIWLRRAFAILLLLVAVRLLWPTPAHSGKTPPPTPAAQSGGNPS